MNLPTFFTQTRVALTIGAIVGMGSTGALKAEENLWLYAKGTDTRPEGSFEFKLASISRIDKASGHYTFNDIRPEIEYGITDKLTIGGEVMIFRHDYSVDDPDLNPMYETQGDDGSFETTQIGGFGLDLKYNILSPYKDWIGLSVGVGFEHLRAYRLDGAGIDQDSWVGSVYLQKNFLDDTLVFALTSKMELERRKAGTVLEEEIAFDISGGISYRIAPKWFVGLEARYQSDFLSPQEDGEFEEGAPRSSWDLSDMRLGGQFQYGLYVGPTVHYAEENWWMTAGLLFQVKGGGNEGRNPTIDGGKVYDEHERMHLGLTFGYEF